MAVEERGLHPQCCLHWAASTFSAVELFMRVWHRVHRRTRIPEQRLALTFGGKQGANLLIRESLRKGTKPVSLITASHAFPTSLSATSCLHKVLLEPRCFKQAQLHGKLLNGKGASQQTSSFSLLRSKQLYNSASEKSHPHFTALISLHFSHTGLFIALIGL